MAQRTVLNSRKRHVRGCRQEHLWPGCKGTRRQCKHALLMDGSNGVASMSRMWKQDRT